jgi:hypothetical protein
MESIDNSLKMMMIIIILEERSDVRIQKNIEASGFYWVAAKP